MKKFVALTLGAAVAAACLSGCGGGGSAGEVNVYNWGEYIDMSVLEDFQKETGIKVNYQTFESNEAMYAVLDGDGADYDVIIPSDYMISRLIDEDKLEPLNFDNIPNFSDVDPELKNPEYDPENLYSVPYMWGLMGVIYNTTMVDEADTGSWDLLWNEKYSNDILMIDNSRDAIGIALKRLGYSYNTTDPDQITEAVDSLIEQKSILQGYAMDQIFSKMEGSNAAIGTYYYGDYLTMAENNPDLAFYLPEEGTNIYVDAMCIPKGAANKENAEAFINYMCSTQAGLKNCEEIWYSTPLMSVREELDPEVSSDPMAYPDAEIMAQCESYTNLPQDILDLYTSEWLRLKAYLLCRKSGSAAFSRKTAWRFFDRLKEAPRCKTSGGLLVFRARLSRRPPPAPPLPAARGYRGHRPAPAAGSGPGPGRRAGKRPPGRS